MNHKVLNYREEVNGVECQCTIDLDNDRQSIVRATNSEAGNVNITIQRTAGVNNVSISGQFEISAITAQVSAMEAYLEEGAQNVKAALKQL